MLFVSFSAFYDDDNAELYILRNMSVYSFLYLEENGECVKRVDTYKRCFIAIALLELKYFKFCLVDRRPLYFPTFQHSSFGSVYKHLHGTFTF